MTQVVRAASGQATERAVLGQQLGLGAALRDAALLDHEDLVGAADGGEPVRDDHRGAAAEERVERLLDQDLARAVDVRRRLVEDQDARVGEQRPGDRDQLPLARREARRRPRGRRGRARPSNRAATRSTPIACAAAATSSSVASGRPKRMLSAIVPLNRNGSWSTTPSWRRYRPQLHVAQVGAVDAHGALERVVEAGDQLRGRRLAAARLADERDAPALGHVDRDAVDDRLVAVGEHDVVELRGGRRSGRSRGAFAIGDVVLGVEHRRDLGHRGARRLHLAVELRELLQRLEDELQHPDRRDQRADLERAAVDHAARRRTARTRWR